MESFMNDNIESEASEKSDSVVVVESSQRKRKRRGKEKANVSDESDFNTGKRSKYHAHFVKSQEKNKRQCKYCKRLITYVSGNGTSALKSHTERCKMFPANLDKKQKLINFESRTITNDDGTTEVVSVPRLWQHDQNFSRKECAAMIIIDELPFAHVEGEGFRRLMKAVQPEFIPPSRATVTRDCYGLYIDERVKLKEFFNKLTSRVCLTTDTWTSGQNLCYMCLTAHFIDDSWTLHKRIINFCQVAGHSGEIIGRTIEQCLLEWNLKRILTVTVDNASANDLAVEYLRRRVNFWKGSVLDGKYMHMRCAAHILNLIVKSGLKQLHTSILKIRAAVRFVRSSPARAKSFKDSVKEVNIKCKGLVSLDVETRWNSTFLMLESALIFKEAFANLSSKGGAFTRHLTKQLGVPNDSDWDAVKTFLPFLEIFYDATLKVSGSLHVTSNGFIPHIVGVGSLISSHCENKNEHIRNMAFKMKEKHDKYWGDVDNMNILLYVAVILDPRHKWPFVEFTIREAFEDEDADMLIVTLKKTLKSLFEAYDTSPSLSSRGKDAPSSTFSSPLSKSSNKEGETKLDARERLMDKWRKREGTSLVSEKKTELDTYLSDNLEPNDPEFDLLGWWKDCSMRRYPILAKLAKDVLAMPISSVASESAFSTGGRVLDSFRTSLTPRIVEALICCQDWIRQSNGPLILEERLADLEAFEERLGELKANQPEVMIDESMALSDEDVLLGASSDG